MTKLKWARISSIFFIIYGVFLGIQIIFGDVWPTEQIHSICRTITGIILLGWGIVFFRGR